jgi:hypothetical protein
MKNWKRIGIAAATVTVGAAGVLGVVATRHAPPAKHVETPSTPVPADEVARAVKRSNLTLKDKNGNVSTVQPMQAKPAAFDSGTQDALDMIHGLDGDLGSVTGAIDTVTSGGNLSDDQVRGLNDITRRSQYWNNQYDILNTGDDIYNKVSTDEYQDMWDKRQRQIDRDIENAHNRIQGVLDEATWVLHHPGYSPTFDPSTDPTNTGYVDW